MTRLFILALAIGCTPKATCPAGVPDGEGNCVPENIDTDVTFAFDTDTRTTVGEGTSWACMKDGDFPGNSVDDPTQRKTIPYAVLGGSADLNLGPMTANRATENSTYIYTVIPVKNVGPQTLCFIQMANLTFSDGENVIATEDLDYVQGSVAALNAVYTNTCLISGEAGFFGSIVEADFDAVSQAKFELVRPDNAGSAPAGHMVPTGYEVSDDHAPVLSEHVLGTAIDVDSLAVWLLRDDGGDPITWGFASAPASAVMDLGDTITHEVTAIDLDHIGSEICLYTDFSPMARSGRPAISCDETLDFDACQRQLWLERNAHEAARHHHN